MSESVAALLMLVLAWTIFAIIVIPQQGPDEEDHVERAYLLGKGVILLDKKAGVGSGGLVDTGLLAYVKTLHYAPFYYLPAPPSAVSSYEIRWTGERTFDPLPGAGYYLPLIYAPQAGALTAGEALGLTVAQSYSLAKAAAILATALILFAAVMIHPANPLVFGVLAVPISISQFSCAGIDGVSTALTIFVMATYLRATKPGQEVIWWAVPALAIALTLLVSSRLHAAPLLFTLYFACRASGRRRDYLISAVCVLLVMIWNVVAMGTILDLRTTSVSRAEIVVYYLTQPFRLVEVLWNTLTNFDIVERYVLWFIGAIGANPPMTLPLWTYQSLFVLLFALGFLSLPPAGGREHSGRLRVLLIGALLSSVIVFLSMLIAATPHPARYVVGVQGRYFTIPFIMIAYAISEGRRPADDWRQRLWLPVWFCFLLISTAGLSITVINRYYVYPFADVVERVHPPTEP